MSFKKFPDYMYEIVVETGEVEVGTYTVDADGELTNIYATLMINGVASLTTQKVYLRAIRSSHTGVPIQSTSIDVTSFASGASWIGKVRFDFAKQSLKQNDTIQVFLGTQNYTKGAVEIGSILEYINPSTGAFDVLSNKAISLTLFNNR